MDSETQASEEATALVDQWCRECHRDGICNTGTGHADLKRRVTEFVDRVSRLALERAAKVCEENQGREGWIALAASIRQLIPGGR